MLNVSEEGKLTINWYENWSVKDLRKKAHDLNIRKWYKMKKEDLIKAITDFKTKVPNPKIDVPPVMEMEQNITSDDIATANEEPTISPKRTISWIILIAAVIFVPLFAWWISQPDPVWYQPALDLFKF